MMKALVRLFRLTVSVIMVVAILLLGSCEVLQDVDVTEVLEDVINVYFDQLPPTSDFTPYSSRWNKTDLTYYIASYAPQISPVEQDVIMSDAFDRWAEVTNLTFERVENAQFADIVIGFGGYNHCELYSVNGLHCDTNASFDGPSGVLAHAYFPGQGEVSGDSHFDIDERWSTSNTDPSAVSLYSVAIHELGHALGLDHSQDYASIMYPSYEGSNIKIALAPSDIENIQALYGASGYLPEGPQNPEVGDIPSEISCGMPASGDYDGDGIDDVSEWFVTGTNPWECDTDGDGLSDYEVYYGLNPLNPDTDGDGVYDGDELRNGTDPLTPDQGNADGTFVGTYAGYDSYGSPVRARVFEDGSATGELEIYYAGMPYTIALSGGIDTNGNLVLLSYDRFFAYYAAFTSMGLEGYFETAGGASGQWYASKTDDARLAPAVPEVEGNVYTPVPEKKSSPGGPVHTRVHWREDHH